MWKHDLSCGCVMHEGDTRSRHPSRDYRHKSCRRHRSLAKHIWPHHVDATVKLLPDEIDLWAAETLLAFVTARAMSGKSVGR